MLVNKDGSTVVLRLLKTLPGTASTIPLYFLRIYLTDIPAACAFICKDLQAASLFCFPEAD